MITIIDYGVGNLFSLCSSFRYIGEEVRVTSDRREIENADRLVLPGVGAFADARQKLREHGLDEVILREAEKGKPLFGICLGMQMLLDRSYEYGVHEGLGLIRGEVRPISEVIPEGYKIPHIGWNALSFGESRHPLFASLDEGDHVYFVHSYYGARCAESVIATAEYGAPLTAAGARDNVMGTQFHPEKSGEIGLRILKEFARFA